jgi:hypothetical protein
MAKKTAMAESERAYWVAVVKERTENGLLLSAEGVIETPESEVLIVETTGRHKLATGLGPRRGWNEVVVTDSDDKGRLGWCPWGNTPDHFWIIWELGSYGTNDEF